MAQPTIIIRLDLLADGLKLQMQFEVDNVREIPITHPSINKTYLENELVIIRELLQKKSRDYDLFLQGTTDLYCDPHKVKDFWHELACWGRAFYRRLFDLQGQDQNLLTWSRIIKNKLNNFRKDKIRFDCSFIELPWGLIYDENVINIRDLKDPSMLINNFWGVKYLLESSPHTSARILLPSKGNFSSLDNQDLTHLIVNINQKMDDDYKTDHQAFFNVIKNTLVGHKDKVFLNLDKEQVLSTLVTRQDPQHLHYYFCHHKKSGGKIQFRGFRDFNESKMIIEGNNDKNAVSITISELNRNENIKPFEYPTVIFLNACESSQIDSGDTDGFMFYFTYFLGACIFIGTEAEIPAKFASYFGSEFINQFLGGQPIGKIISDIIYKCASEYYNPFGLYYKLHGNGDKYLQRSIINVPPLYN